MTNDQLNGKSSKQRYTKEFKEQVLGVYRSGAYKTISECARAYDIKESTLYQWVYRLHKADSGKTTDQSEVVKLRKELARANLELEILKKAAIYFAKQAK